MKKLPKIFSGALTVAIIYFFFTLIACFENGEFSEIPHVAIPLIIAILSRRYIVRKEAQRTIRELAYLAYERSPKTKLRGQFVRYPKVAERYLSTEEKAKLRLSRERFGEMPW